MKKRGRYFGIFLWSGILAAALLGGCGSGSKGISADLAVNSMEMKEEAAEAEEEFGYDMAASEEIAYDMGGAEAPAEAPAAGAEGDAVKSAAMGRKLIRSVYMNTETREFDSFLQQVSEQVSVCGGYVENSSISGNGYYYRGGRYASMTLRIPSEKLDGFISGVSVLCNVTNKRESVEDITLRYVDAESRKKALEVEQERLLSLLEKAESVEDIITIETRLSEVRYELESYGSQLRTFDNQVNYSTVQMEICEVERETPTEEKTAWDRMKNGFAESMYDIGREIRNFGINIFIHIPYIVIWAVILFLLYKIGKIIYHKILKGGTQNIQANTGDGKPQKRRKLFGRKKSKPGEEPRE